MLRELEHLSIVLGISENLLLQQSFSYVKQEFSWVGTDDCKLKGRQWDREQRAIEVSVVSRNDKNKGLFRMTEDEVSVVSGGLSGRFLVLTGQWGCHYVQKTLKGI